MSNRRDFLRQSAAALAMSKIQDTHSALQADQTAGAFAAKQEARRKELWSLLGELPTAHVPGTPKVVSTEKHEGYTLQRLVLDLNGIEPVPALLLIPDKRPARAPGLLYIHWHGGM